jgi:hypothetical protein
MQNGEYQDVLVPFLSIMMCLLPSFLSRYACSLPFYQDVLVTFLSIKMCLFPSFLLRYACSLLFNQDVFVPLLSIKMCLLPSFPNINAGLMIFLLTLMLV